MKKDHIINLYVICFLLLLGYLLIWFKLGMIDRTIDELINLNINMVDILERLTNIVMDGIK